MSRIEKKISSIVEQQFPAFYRSEGETFVEFVKTYYEWMEEEGNVLYAGRNFLENTDIDTTIDDFLYFYQKKYLYGIPFDVIINKRYLLKHVLDVYRSKGSIQAYKLLFKLIYNQDIEVYLPGRDMLRASAGKFKQPKYLEVTNVDGLAELVGATIYGMTSKVTATVESYVTEVLNQNIIASLYISNIRPRGALFEKGEKIVNLEDLSSSNLSNIIVSGPTVLGSLDTVEIINGGQDFEVGDVLKIVHKDIITNEVVSFGTEGLLRVANTTRGRGSITFSILNGGSGYLANADVFIYNNPVDTTGSGANFEIGSFSDITYLDYNADIIGDYANTLLNASTFQFPGNTSANVTSTLSDFLTFYTGTFATILSLTSIDTGNAYTHSVDTYVRSTLRSNTLPGNVSYNSASANITGTGTFFSSYFANGDTIELQANTSLSNTIEKHIITTVANDTVIVLAGKPSKNSSASAVHRMRPSILPANYAVYEDVMYRDDSTVPGLNANISGQVSLGNGVISELKAITSGKGYVDDEYVTLYLYGGISAPSIITPGSGYTNGDMLIFAGGQPNEIARGTVSTNSNGAVTSVSMAYNGSGYIETPTITVRSNTGSGAYITASVTEFNTTVAVTGRVNKSGVGRQRGYWTTTAGFLNSDKYLQDSYFYQDFSYQIKTASSLAKYRDILYDTFHIAGAEMFGEYLVINTESSESLILYESNTAIIG